MDANTEAMDEFEELSRLPFKPELWTPGEDLILKARYEEGVTLPLIIAELGRSRGAVVGRAKRLGLQHPNQKNRSYRFLKNPDRAPLPASGPEPVIYTIPEGEPAPDNADPKPLHELEPNQCRYPYGDGPFIFCGAPRQGKSYCVFHHNLCWGRKW